MTAVAVARNERVDWLLWRRQGIGGSDAAAILGLDPFRSPLDVWLDKRGLLPLDRRDGEGEVQYWGQALEPAVIRRFERETDLYVLNEQTRLERPGMRWMRATIDGYVSDARAVGPQDVFVGWTPLGIFEAKTTSARSWDWAEGVPIHVQIQVQHNLAVAELDQAWLAVLITAPALRFKVFQIDRDQAAIDALIQAERDFWRRVENDDMPAVTEASDVEALKQAYGDVDVAGPSVDLTPAAAALVEDLRSARAAAKVAEEQVGLVEAQLMQILRDRTVGLVDERPVITWKQHSKAYGTNCRTHSRSSSRK